MIKKCEMEKNKNGVNFECWCTLTYSGASYPVAQVKAKNKREARIKFKRMKKIWSEECLTFTVHEIKEEDREEI